MHLSFERSGQSVAPAIGCVPPRLRHMTRQCLTALRHTFSTAQAHYRYTTERPSMIIRMASLTWHQWGTSGKLHTCRRVNRDYNSADAMPPHRILNPSLKLNSREVQRNLGGLA